MDAYERRCRLLMRAYPPRFREHRGDELLGTLLDIAVPGQERPGLWDGFDIVRGGLLTRLRDRPPAGQWILYRLFGRPVLDRYRMWVRDDLRSRFYISYAIFFRATLLAFALKGLDVLVLVPLGVDLLSHTFVPMAMGFTIQSANVTRRRTWDRYGFEDADVS